MYEAPMEERPRLETRGKIAQRARKVMSQITAWARVDRALPHNVPCFADTSFEPGDKVLVWKEKQLAGRIGEWIGPLTVESFDAEWKLTFIVDQAGVEKFQFNYVQVKVFVPLDDDGCA